MDRYLRLACDGIIYSLPGTDQAKIVIGNGYGVDPGASPVVESGRWRGRFAQGGLFLLGVIHDVPRSSLPPWLLTIEAALGAKGFGTMTIPFDGTAWFDDSDEVGLSMSQPETIRKALLSASNGPILSAANELKNVQDSTRLFPWTRGENGPIDVIKRLTLSMFEAQSSWGGDGKPGLLIPKSKFQRKTA